MRRLVLFALVVAFLLLAGCAPKDSGKQLPPATETPAQIAVDVPAPQLEKGVGQLDLNSYTDPQGRFIAAIMNQMVLSTQAGK